MILANSLNYQDRIQIMEYSSFLFFFFFFFTTKISSNSVTTAANVCYIRNYKRAIGECCALNPVPNKTSPEDCHSNSAMGLLITFGLFITENVRFMLYETCF